MMKRTPKSECTRKIVQDRSILKIWRLVNICTKVNFFENWTLAQFSSLEWRNGSQNRNVLEKLSGTGPFWNFWLFGHGQRSAWSKHFFYFFLFQGVRIRVKPGRSGSNLDQRVSSVGDDVIHDVTLLRTHVARVVRATRVARLHAWRKPGAWDLMEARVRWGEHSGGACRRVAALLIPKFLGFVLRRP